MDFDNTDDGQDNEKNGFIGFVLLDELKWDKQKLISDLKQDWQIDISANEDEDEKYKDIIVEDFDDVKLAISYMPTPIPEGEAEYFAGANYMWEDAIETTKKHKAQILVAALGDETNIKKQATFLVKAISSCLKQKGAIAVYSDGAVYEPAFYLGFAEMAKTDEIVIPNLVWFGIHQSETDIGFYTYGMKKFGKKEIEMYTTSKGADLNEMRDFLLGIVSYIIESDITLQDGETIGTSENQKLPITYSDGIELDGKTLKIKYM